MKRILFYFSQVGGLNALLPLLQSLRFNNEFVAVYSCRAIVGNYMAQKSLEYLNVPTTDLEGWIAGIAPDLIVTDTINLQRAHDATDNIRLWKVASQLHIPCIAYVDAWGSYSERFASASSYLPTLVATVDQYARQELLNAIPLQCEVVIAGSPRLELLAKNTQPISSPRYHEMRSLFRFKENETVILFVSQPLQKTINATKDWGYTERTTLTALCETINSSASEIVQHTTLTVIPHPEEDRNKLEKFILQQKPNCTIRVADQQENNFSAIDLVACSDLVLGMFSTLLVEAVVCKRPVISLQIGLCREDMLITNRVGATNSIQEQSILASSLVNAISQKSVREQLVLQGNLFQPVANAQERWLNLFTHFAHATTSQLPPLRPNP